MNYYYLDANNQPVGPLPLDEIRQKAAAGQIAANPMVAAAGGNQWQPLGGIRASAAAGFAFDQMLADAAASVVRAAQGALSAGFVEAALELTRRAGHYLVTAAGGLGVVYAIYAAVKNRSVTVVISALILLVGLAFAQFAARHFFRANQKLLTPTPVSSAALLECIALLALLVGLSSVVTAVTVWIEYGMWQPIVPAVLGAAFWTIFGAVALHPETVAVEIRPSGAGQQVVGLLAFFCKALLKLVPLAFFAAAALGSLAIVLSFFDSAGYVLGLIPSEMVPMPRNLGIGAGFAGLGAVIFACLLPLLAHLLFIVVSLPLDLWGSILTVPEKLDALKR
jgi:hypothetical protein